MNQYLEKSKDQFQKCVSHLKQDISGLKTGRATPALVENVTIESYGSRMPLQQLATIGIPDPKTILIQPWDKSIIKEIEKGLLAANLGLNPVNEGQAIRLSIPALTEEKRKELVKILKQKVEQGKQSVRRVRDEIREQIMTAEKEKTLSQDEKFRFLKELDDHTGRINDEIKQIGEEKEKEIMTI